MEFRIADTFTDSLSKLTGDEQKAVKTAAFDLQLNPANPSLQLHKLDSQRRKVLVDPRQFRYPADCASVRFESVAVLRGSS